MKASEISHKGKYFLSAIITCIILLSVYAIKGIYPFGAGNIAYYDMPQLLIPDYYHTWDVLHGSKSLIYDWCSALGSSKLYFMCNSVLNPFNLFFFFVSRNNVSNSMSLFLLMKMAIAAFSMSFYLFKRYKKLLVFFAVVLSVSYAFCGYALQYYTLINYFDLVSIFPILMYSWELLVEENKTHLYLIFMTLCMIIHVYLMFMVCIYLIVRTYLKVMKFEKDRRDVAIFKFSLISIFSFILSSFSTIPNAYIIMNSPRMDVASSQSNYLKIIQTILSPYGDPLKKFMLFGCEGILAIFIFVLIFKRKEIKTYTINLIMTVFLLAPVFIEGTNQLWHIGGYVHFPMRFGYLVAFELIVFAADYFECETFENKALSFAFLNKIFGYVSIAMIPMVLMVLYAFIKPFTEYGIRAETPYAPIYIYFSLSIICILFALVSKNKMVVLSSLSVIMLSESVMGAYGLIGPKYEASSECSINLLNAAVDLNEYDIGQGRMDLRFKNIGSSLTVNYPYINNINSPSNWTWGINPNLQSAREALGYGTAYTRILDEGGTVFADELFGITNIISKNIENDSLYSKYDEFDGFSFYTSNYQLPFALNVSSIPEINPTHDYFEYQNELFSQLTGLDKPLFIEEYYYFDAKKGPEIDEGLVLNLDVKGEKTLYVLADGYKFEVKVNDTVKYIPFLEEYENTVYPLPFINGFLECGTYKDETVAVELDKLDLRIIGEKINRYTIQVALMDMDVLREGNDILSRGKVTSIDFGKSSLHVNGQAVVDGYIYLPIAYQDSFVCYVNGEKAEIQKGVNDSLVFVPVKEGEYEIRISFRPMELIVGIIVSLLGLLFAAVYYLNKKKIDNSVFEKVAGKFAYIVLVLATAIIFIFMYVLPVLGCIYVNIKNIL